MPRIWLRRILEVILFCILWVPIVLTGLQNIQEQRGGGHGQPWDSVGAKLSGWGLWLVVMLIWFVVVNAIGQLIVKKLGLLKPEELENAEQSLLN